MALCLWALLLSVACGVDVPSVQLNNGVSMPVLAFAAEVWDAGTCLNATAEALAAGFRFIWSSTLVGDDCQKAQSQAVRNSGLPRTELFIAGTVNDPKCSDYASCYKETRAGAEKQFQLLDEKVLDMLMLDYPAESCRGIKGQWQALTDLYRQTGRVRSIAVSNFNLTQIQCATSWEFVTMEPEVPAVNQMRFAVGHGHDPVVAQDAKLGIRVQAYSPLAKGKLATDALCQKIGESHGKSAVQVALKWILQSNATIATQSTSPQHLRSDLDLFDFSLTDEEMQQLNDHSPELFVV